ncbi:MAG: DUF1565 domain-containing protein [Methanosarcinaceae archaeon]|nr:DUF1565 domain-containing protein [Methanosarcinaceae archaeon]
MKSGKPESRVIAVALVVMIFSLMIGAASAKTWYVDDDGGSGVDFTNIQNAIDAASDGDTVFVYNGTYYENINLKDGIMMQGESADVTTINGSGNKVVVEAGNSTIAGFTITGGDWGIFSGYSSPIITNNIISDNIELGILCWSSEIISNNIISSSQSGIYCSGSSPIITNNIITGNSIEGIFCEGSSPTITNNVIIGNELGISCDISSPAISHNDVWDNGEDKEDNYHGCVAGISDITADPLFIDPTNSDYHLQAGSPCIDAGTNEGAPSTDFDGNPRPIDGDGDGIAIVDIGAFEYNPESMRVKVNIDPDTLNLKSKGKWMTAYIELPAGYDIREIGTTKVNLVTPSGETAPVDPSAPATIGDYNSNGILDLMVKFDRAAVVRYLDGTRTDFEVALKITGNLMAGTPFEGIDTIRVVNKGK